MSKPDAEVVEYLEFENNRLLPLLFGEHDEYLARIERAIEVTIVARGNRLVISGKTAPVAAACTALKKLYERLEKGRVISGAEIDASVRLALSAQTELSESLAIATRRRVVMPRSEGQALYIQALQSHKLVFGIGPAGTGKTYLAVAMGVSKLLSGEVDRMILSRPAVEAGEQLGFLPGDMREKVDPYLRPLYDALYDMIPADQVERRLSSGEIEVAPLAFMRGRTLSNAYVILDEAQNTSIAQMKMFLTRMGPNSYMVITGDLTQIDLPSGQTSGLKDAKEILTGIPSIQFVPFDERDIVRHRLVTDIVKAYAKRDLDTS